RALLARALLDLGGPEGDTNDDARLHQRAAVVRTRDEVAKHRFGDFEVRDDAVTQGANRLDVPRRAAEHVLGLAADGQDSLLSPRSEEHTSELQSRENLVCRLLLEKKKMQDLVRHI